MPQIVKIVKVVDRVKSKLPTICFLNHNKIKKNVLRNEFLLSLQECNGFLNIHIRHTSLLPTERPKTPGVLPRRFVRVSGIGDEYNSEQGNTRGSVYKHATPGVRFYL